MQSVVAGREVAATADTLGDLAPAGCGERQARALTASRLDAGAEPSSVKVTK